MHIHIQPRPSTVPSHSSKPQPPTNDPPQAPSLRTVSVYPRPLVADDPMAPRPPRMNEPNEPNAVRRPSNRTTIYIHELKNEKEEGNGRPLLGRFGSSSSRRSSSRRSSSGQSVDIKVAKEKRASFFERLTRTFSSTDKEPAPPKRLEISALLPVVESIECSVTAVYVRLHTRLMRLNEIYPTTFPLFGAPNYRTEESPVVFLQEIMGIINGLRDDITLLRSSKNKDFADVIEQVRSFWEDHERVMNAFPFLFNLTDATSEPPTSLKEIPNYLEKEIINRGPFTTKTWSEIHVKMIDSKFWEPRFITGLSKLRQYSLIWVNPGPSSCPYAEDMDAYEAALDSPKPRIWRKYATEFAEKEEEKRRSFIVPSKKEEEEEEIIEELGGDEEAHEIELKEKAELTSMNTFSYASVREAVRRFTQFGQRISVSGSTNAYDELEARRSSSFNLFRKKLNKGKGIDMSAGLVGSPASSEDGDIAIVDY